MTSTAAQHKDPYEQAIREQSERMDSSFREHDERQRLSMRRPFLDERLMTNENPPNCRAQDFSTPRLRKCPFLFEDLSSVDGIIPDPDPFSGNCDGRADGCNWKVAFNGVEGGPFVMKMFWDCEPPELPRYYSAQRECQNNAILQQIQEALSPENTSRGPILLLTAPLDETEARHNLFAFCDEQRASYQQHPERRLPELVRFTSMPRFRQCHGWIKVSGQEIAAKIPPRLLPPDGRIDKLHRVFDRRAMYTAIIYEFVESGENVAETMQKKIDFLAETGFSHSLWSRSANWTNSILLDLSDFVHVGGKGWTRHQRLQAAQLLER